jgi:hypothetical protein
MQRKLQRAVFIPATSRVIYSLDNEQIGEKRKNFSDKKFYSFLNNWVKKRIKKYKRKGYKIFNPKFESSSWLMLYAFQEKGFKPVLYKTRQSELSESEIENAIEIMKRVGLTPDFVKNDNLIVFEDYIDNFNININNSVFIAHDYSLLNTLDAKYHHAIIYNMHDVQDKIVGFYYYYWEYEYKDIQLDAACHRPGNLYLNINKTLFYADHRFLYSSNVKSDFFDKIFYVEENYNHEIHSFIRSNIDWINKKAKEKGCDFIYVAPLQLCIDSNWLVQYVRYVEPTLSPESINDVARNLSMVNDNINSSQILSFLNMPKIGSPALIRNLGTISCEPVNKYSFFPLDIKNNIKDQFEKYFKGLAPAFLIRDDIFFSYEKTEPKDLNSDYRFLNEANIISDDVKEKINILKENKQMHFLTEIALHLLRNLSSSELGKMGINSPLLAKELEQPKISRLLIQWTSKFDFDIILPDYGNLLVEMPRLPKALYYFFLQHPEGILFAKLCDYRQELIQIYSRISNLSDKEEIIKNIDRLVDPMDNSINVNCSRIKSAFVKLIDDNLACNYYINGVRGEHKKVGLPHNLIEIINLQ